MSQSSDPKFKDSTPKPRKERLSPGEMLGFSAVLAGFAALIVMMATRSWTLTLIFAGIAFVSSLILVVLVGLGKEPVSEDGEGSQKSTVL